MSVSGKRPVNIGILAHVDGGKTTFTEQILFVSGAIRSMGRVDEGSAHTDFMDIERRRGISVRSASVFINWKGHDINIIDTPGHSDFSGEVQRAIRAMDMAVIVVSAVEGIQSQTEIIWKALSSAGIPAIFFINKTDRSGADSAYVMREISDDFGIKLFVWDESNRDSLIETASENDDSLLEKYIDHGSCSISDEELYCTLHGIFYSRSAFPCLSGSALKGEGIVSLLDVIVRLAKDDESRPGDKLSGIIFKLEHDPVLGRVSYVRLYSGSLKNRDTVHNATAGTDEKIVQIRKMQGAKEKDTGKLSAGDIGAVYGLSSARNGDILGEEGSVPKEFDIASPMLRVKISPLDDDKYPALISALEQLSAEDPLLDIIWQRDTNELLVRVVGLIQIEILKTLLEERFNLIVSSDDPVVIYKERPSGLGEGYVEYTMPKPCWAVMRFGIEPLPVGSGVVFESNVGSDKIARCYQEQIRQTIPDALKQGPKGWEVTDIKITLIGGEHHVIHTHPLDFVLATPIGIMDGLVNAGTELMEPMQKFKLSFPEELSGKMIGEIISMRGTFDSPVIKRGSAFMEGRLPVAESMYFPVKLSSVTGGKGYFSASFDGYEICPPGKGKEIPYRGINPLDKAKYILYMRGAIV